MSRRRDIIILGANGPEHKSGTPAELPWPGDDETWFGLGYDDAEIAAQAAEDACWAGYNSL